MQPGSGGWGGGDTPGPGSRCQQAKEAGEVFGRALAIDRRSANTWRALINSGPKAVSDLAARDPEYLAVMDLRPQGSIYAVVTERLIRFPEERQYSFASRATDEE